MLSFYRGHNFACIGRAFEWHRGKSTVRQGAFYTEFSAWRTKKMQPAKLGKNCSGAKQIEVLSVMQFVLSFVKKSFKRVDFWLGVCYNSLVKIIHPVSYLERCDLSYDT